MGFSLKENSIWQVNPKDTSCQDEGNYWGSLSDAEDSVPTIGS